MMAGTTIFSNAVVRAMLCLALFVALLGQNFSHIADESAAHSIGVASDSSAPIRGNDSTPAGTPADCGDYGCHLTAPLRTAIAICPMRPVLGTAVPACGPGADLPHPDKPPRP